MNGANLDFGPDRRLREIDRNLAVDVESVTLEESVGFYLERHHEVTRGRS